jgi:hypothetical protein
MGDKFCSSRFKIRLSCYFDGWREGVNCIIFFFLMTENAYGDCSILVKSTCNTHMFSKNLLNMSLFSSNTHSRKKGANQIICRKTIKPRVNNLSSISQVTLLNFLFNHTYVNLLYQHLEYSHPSQPAPRRINYELMHFNRINCL